VLCTPFKDQLCQLPEQGVVVALPTACHTWPICHYLVSRLWKCPS